MSIDLDPAVRRLVDAANGGDVTAFVAAFTDDGVVDDWGREFRGSAEIRSWSDAEFIGRQVKLTVQGVEIADGQTVIQAEVGGKGYTGPGHFAFNVDGGRVSRMTITG
jgi:hypothetical protein